MNFIKEPLTIGMEPFSIDRIAIHQKILNKKSMIKNVFKEFHITMLDFASQNLSLAGDEVELGAGVFPIKNTKHKVLATDILPAPHLDRTLDAQNLDLKSESISVIYGQNCFHHFPQPELFFHEASRVLKNGGGIVLIEPHFGFLSNLIYKKLFSVEGYDRNSPHWLHLENDLPNQALGYLCFVRDRTKFEAKFPKLEIVQVKPAQNWIRYLLSGGLNFRQIVPDFAVPIVKFMETILKPFAPLLALHCYFVIRKKI